MSSRETPAAGNRNAPAGRTGSFSGRQGDVGLEAQVEGGGEHCIRRGQRRLPGRDAPMQTTLEAVAQRDQCTNPRFDRAIVPDWRRCSGSSFPVSHRVGAERNAGTGQASSEVGLALLTVERVGPQRASLGLCPGPRDSRRHGSGVRWGRAAGPSANREGAPDDASPPRTPDAPIGAPSAWLSLARLRPRRAGRRFTRQGCLLRSASHCPVRVSSSVALEIVRVA